MDDTVNLTVVEGQLVVQALDLAIAVAKVTATPPNFDALQALLRLRFKVQDRIDAL